MHFSAFLKNKKTLILLVFLFFVVLNFALRMINITYPDSVVFDEAHFAQYSAAYGSREAHIDIHPPLGKMIFGIPLFFEPQKSFQNATFVEYNFLNTKESISQTPQTTYGFFPYKILRSTSALIGALLVGVLFLLVFAGTKSFAPSIFAAFLLTFENALLLETRLILIDGTMLLFGFLGLACLFQKKNYPIWSGIFIGLSLSVKLTGIIFLLTGLFSLFRKKEENKKNLKNFLKFIIAVASVFLFVSVFLENIWVSPQAHENLFQKTLSPVFTQETKNFSASPLDQKIATALPESLQSLLRIWTMQSFFSLESYTLTGTGPDFIRSRWYEWPFLGGAFPYYNAPNASADLVLFGNPFVWGLGLTGLFVFLFRFIKNLKRREHIFEETSSFTAALGFFCVAYLLIFALLVHRGTFLYHYFPVLIASVCLFAIFFWQFIGKKSPRAQFWWYFLFGILTIVQFILVSPFTYGFVVF